MIVTFGFTAAFVGVDISPELLSTGLVILPLGLIALGTAMLGAPDYGTRIGGTTVALGVFALIGFHLALGWRTRRLASATSTTARSTTNGV